MFRPLALIAAFAALASLCRPVLGDTPVQVFVPLTIDYATLEAALKRQIYTAPGGRALLWKGENACEFLTAQNPRFGRNGPAMLTLESEGELALGVQVGDKCVNPISWQGIIAVDATPTLTSKLALVFHLSNINLYDRQHQKSLIVGRGFDLIKGNFIPRFETFKFDLHQPIEEFRYLAEEAAPPDQAERFKETLATVHPAGPAIAAPDGVRITLGLTAPRLPAAAPAAPSGPLTPAELAAWDKQLSQWDAFIVFAIKQVGEVVADKQVRADLLNVLLSGRYRLAHAIGQPPAAGGPDPVRVLFLDQWRELRDIVRKAAARGQLGDRALEFLSFISAGDALMAFDQAAPALGARISAADLRRLARIMAPQSTADPLQFNYQVDPELQHLFGFAPPPETPGSVEPSDSDEGEPLPSPAAPPVNASATPQATATPIAASPAAPSTPFSIAPPMTVRPVTPSATATPFSLQTLSPSTPAPAAPSPWSTPGGTSSRNRTEVRRSIATALGLLSPLDVLAEEPPQTTDLKQLGKTLRRAVVNESNVKEYTHNLSALLDAAAASEIAEEKPDPGLESVYRLIVRTAAWQESCWRQFVVSGGRIRYLESSSHDIGLMQINRYVWRGFYNIRHVEWDVAYNAGAGSQILARLMLRAAAQRTSDADALARSVYAGYNGGPNDLNRWRRAKQPKQVREIDQAFWEKYQALKQGQSLNILKCAAEWGGAPGH